MSPPAGAWSGTGRQDRGPDADVLVVGAGPAGSALAGLLAAGGRTVVLVDRAAFPRAKPCGECVNPGAVAAMARLGLLEHVRSLDPAPLTGWCVTDGGAAAVGSFRDDETGLGIARADLDHALVRHAVSAGVHLIEGVRLESVTPAAATLCPTARLRTEGGHRVLRPRLVVGADGLRSRVARSIGRIGRAPRLHKVSVTCRLDWPGAPAAWRTRGILDVRGGVTLGVAPVSSGGSAWNATVVVDAPGAHRDRLSADPMDFVAAVLEERLGHAPARRIVDGPWTSGPFDRPVTEAWAPGVVLVGDAAGYYDPFTGQGIYRALRSAELAAPAVLGALTLLDAGHRRPWSPLAAYARAWRRETRTPRLLQRAVGAVMARPRLRTLALPRLTRGRLDAVIRVTGDAAPVSSLLHPAWWLPTLLGNVRRSAPPTADPTPW